MRINLPDDKMAYIAELSDKLDISVSELIKRATHIVDTLQLCDAQGIKAVFLEEDEQLEFKDLFDVFITSPTDGQPGETTGHTESVDPEACTDRVNTNRPDF